MIFSTAFEEKAIGVEKLLATGWAGWAGLIVIFIFIKDKTKGKKAYGSHEVRGGGARGWRAEVAWLTLMKYAVRGVGGVC